MSIQACHACRGDGFFFNRCGCREALCPHVSAFIDGTDERQGIYQKFWVRRIDGSSNPRSKHATCEYFVLDWDHDKFAPIAARAYADACETEYPDLARDLRARATKAEGLVLGERAEALDREGGR